MRVVRLLTHKGLSIYHGCITAVKDAKWGIMALVSRNGRIDPVAPMGYDTNISTKGCDMAGALRVVHIGYTLRHY